MYIFRIGALGGINFFMSDSKKLVVNLSEIQDDEFDRVINESCKKRSGFIKDALILYIEQKKKMRYVEEMKKGYLEMAEINLEISEMGFANDVCELIEYEAKLSESDFPDDNSSEKRRYILC